VIDSVGYPEGHVGPATSLHRRLLPRHRHRRTQRLPRRLQGQHDLSDGNGDFSQLVGSDADSTNNYLLVNEAGAPVTTSYVESDTVGQRDFYAMGDIDPVQRHRAGVQVSAYCNNPDGGAGRSAKLGSGRAPVRHCRPTRR
jgi:hypothetical protein